MAGDDAQDAQGPSRIHPHELVHCQARRTCCLAPGTVRICGGCGDDILPQAERYRCGNQPPCDFHLCTVCFNLGPGEGGFIQTASIDKLPISKNTSREFPIRSPDSGNIPEPAAPAPLNQPPRIAAAKMDFGLDLDAQAQTAWAGLSELKEPPKNTPAELFKTVQLAARHLRFLELTVLPQGDLIDEQESRLKSRCLELYSPLAGVPQQAKDRLIAQACGTLKMERSMGSLVGMAVGDSVGAPFEFLDAVDNEGSSGSMFNLSKFRGAGAKNKFRVAPGQWTDDASMGLCLADSLLAKGHYDGSDARIRFHNWWFRGYNNAFGNDSRIGSVGLGSNVAKSLRAMHPGKRPSPCYEARSQDAGNGTIMRLAAVPIFYADDPAEAARMSAASSAATHPGPIAAAAAAFLGYAIAKAINRSSEQPQTPKAFLDSTVKEYLASGLVGAGDCPELVRLLRSSEPRGGKEECWNWRASRLHIESSLMSRGDFYNGYPCTANYFGSYCIDGLAVALWCFYHTSGFAEAIVRCTNFLGDADTTSAICGQLAGAFYGYKAIDKRWIGSLEQWDNSETACRAVLLCVRRASRLQHTA